jgi:hypothetical protein
MSSAKVRHIKPDCAMASIFFKEGDYTFKLYSIKKFLGRGLGRRNVCSGPNITFDIRDLE